MPLADYRRVDEREANAIMSQGAVRPETALDREERRILDADLATSPLKGRPLRHRLRNFRPDADAAIRALGGPPLWMRRLREIEDGIEWHEVFLEDAWRTLAKQAGDPAEFAVRWTETAATWRFARINRLIDQHNRNFPVEARLPMDPVTRDFVRINGQPYRRALLGAAWVLERFPADVRAVPPA